MSNASQMRSRGAYATPLAFFGCAPRPAGIGRGTFASLLLRLTTFLAMPGQFADAADEFVTGLAETGVVNAPVTPLELLQLQPLNQTPGRQDEIADGEAFRPLAQTG